MSNIVQNCAPTLTTRGAAKYLCVSEAGMARWRGHGGGPAYLRLGKRTVRYRVADLDAFLASHVTQAKAD